MSDWTKDKILDALGVFTPWDIVPEDEYQAIGDILEVASLYAELLEPSDDMLERAAIAICEFLDHDKSRHPDRPTCKFSKGLARVALLAAVVEEETDA